MREKPATAADTALIDAAPTTLAVATAAATVAIAAAAADTARRKSTL